MEIHQIGAEHPALLARGTTEHDSDIEAVEVIAGIKFDFGADPPGRWRAKLKLAVDRR